MVVLVALIVVIGAAPDGTQSYEAFLDGAPPIETIEVGADNRRPGPFGLLLGGGRELDEAALQAIAKKTGGHYFRARDTRSLQQIYALLDEIEPVSEDDQSYRPVTELYAWPLGAALLLSLLMALLFVGGRWRSAGSLSADA